MHVCARHRARLQRSPPVSLLTLVLPSGATPGAKLSSPLQCFSGKVLAVGDVAVMWQSCGSHVTVMWQSCDINTWMYCLTLVYVRTYVVCMHRCTEHNCVLFML